jgi:hypothetical protein
MKLFGYRKPSLKRALGISGAKAKLTRMTGGAAVRNPKSVVKNFERKVKRKAGYYSPVVKAARNRKLW